MSIPDVSLKLSEALLRSCTQESPPRKPPEERLAFTITVSREVGALGHTVAEEVGKRLGWPVYDQELIDKIAEEIGRPSFHVRGLDEKPVGWLEEFFTSLGGQYPVSPMAYLKKLTGVVSGLGAMGKCIIVGRGANFILPRETTLRVRLVADLKDRVRAIGWLKDASDKEAARFIEKTDRERALFVHGNFGKDVTDPHHYDLVINTSSVGLEEAAQVILDTLRVFEKRGAAAAPKQGEPITVG
jgi:hypothetical protein